MDITKRISQWLVASLLLPASLSIQAALLDLNLLSPDITSNFMSVSFDAGTGAFTADGFASTLDGSDIIGGQFTLNADISAGGILNSGTISITGTSGIYTSGTLITGNLFELGYANGSSILEFLFTPTGGDLLGAYTSGIGGIIMSASGYTGTDFDTSFSTSFNTFADTAPVPVPAALWLFGSGLLALTGIARRRNRVSS